MDNQTKDNIMHPIQIFAPSFGCDEGVLGEDEGDCEGKGTTQGAQDVGQMCCLEDVHVIGLIWVLCEGICTVIQQEMGADDVVIEGDDVVIAVTSELRINHKENFMCTTPSWPKYPYK